MAFTEQELNIANQVKQQGGSRQDFLEVLQQYRSQQPTQQEITKETTQEIETPQETVWVQSTDTISNQGIESQETVLSDTPTEDTTQEPNLFQKISSLGSAPFRDEGKAEISEVVSSTPEAIKTVWKWIGSFVWGIFDSAEQTAWGLFNMLNKDSLKGANSIRKLLGKEPLTTEQAKEIQSQAWASTEGLESNYSEDILDIWQGTLSNTIKVWFPTASLGISTTWETQEWEQLLGKILEYMQVGWEFVNKLPLLKDFRESLPEDRRPDFDAFTGQAILAWAPKIKDTWVKIKDKFTEADREISKPAWNILWWSKADFTEQGSWKSAQRGLIDVIDKNKDVEWVNWFGWLKDIVTKEKKQSFKPLKEWFTNAQNKLNELERDLPLKWKTQDKSISSALNHLEDWFDWVKSSKLKEVQSRIRELKNNHDTQGLSIEELQEVKRLHTTHSKLFTDKGKDRWKTLSADDLRGLRTDIKTLIEERAKKWGVDNISELNNKYADILNAETFLENRKAELESWENKILPQGVVKTLVEKMLNIPWIAETITAAWRGVMNTISSEWSWAKAVKIVDMEAEIPKLIKEIRKKKGHQEILDKVKQELSNLGFYVIWDQAVYLGEYEEGEIEEELTSDNFLDWLTKKKDQEKIQNSDFLKWLTWE